MALAPRLAAAAAALPFLAAAARAQFDLASPRPFAVESRPEDVAFADFDEDGRLDVVVADDAGLLFVSFSSRDRELLSHEARRRPGPRPFALDAADADGDGHADILVAGPDGATVLFGDGRGGFAPSFVIGPLSSRCGATFVDLDRDGLLDVAVGAHDVLWVRLVRQSAPRAFEISGGARMSSPPRQIYTGDFDGDGSADVLALAGGVVWIRGDGAGGALSVTNIAGAGSDDVDVGDFDGDGRTDFVGLSMGGYFSVFRGDASFGLVYSSSQRVARETRLVRFARLGGPVRLDAAIVGEVVAELAGDGSGGFSQSRRYRLGFGAEVLGVADLTGDGIDEMVAIGPWGVGVVIANDSIAPLATSGIFLVDPPEIAVGDFDEDGHADIATVSQASSTQRDVVLLRGDGRGGATRSGITHLDGRAKSLAAADVDADGHLDVAVASAAKSTVTIYRGTGGRLLPTPPVAVGPAPVSVRLADFDGDGRLDLAVSLLEGRAAEVRFGGGDAMSFGPPVTLGVDGVPSALTVGDLNADGAPDVLVPVLSPPRLFAFTARPDRGFGGIELGPVGAEPRTAAIGDFDGDGDADIALTDGREPAIRLFLGDGAGGFLAAPALSIAAPAHGLAAADLSGDGRTDLAALDARGGLVFVLLARTPAGAGFEPASVHFAGRGCENLAIADWNEDGRPDVLAPSDQEDAIFSLPFRETEATRALAGTVDAADGTTADVLFVNGGAGDHARRLEFGPADPLEFAVEKPPRSGGRAPFALYLWRGIPDGSTIRDLPFGLGRMAFPMPLAPGSPAPLVVWNNAGRAGSLGAATRPSAAAPTILERAPRGVGRSGAFTLQGLIADPGAPNGRAAVTNGVAIVIR